MALPLFKLFGHRGCKFLGGGNGSSIKTEISFAKLYIDLDKNTPKLLKKDYGKDNFEKYGQEEVPEYIVENIKTKIHIFAMEKDLHCSLEAAKVFESKVNQSGGKVEVIVMKDWYHLTCIAPKNADILFSEYTRILD